MPKYYYKVKYPNGETKNFDRLVDIIEDFGDFQNRERTIATVMYQLNQRNCSMERIKKPVVIVRRSREHAQKYHHIVRELVEYAENKFGSLELIDDNDSKIKEYRRAMKEMEME